jgi:hypothetical protein
MRFLADGPTIPDELLEERDQGRVVFFAGAGISMPAGLPSFRELAEKTLTLLGAAPDAEAWELIADERGSLDRVFTYLYDEYRREDVDRVVKKLLRPRKPGLGGTTNHRTILRLSQSIRRDYQVVTTNFDHLFESSAGSILFHVAPNLPDISITGSFSGLVYLHGRMSDEAQTGGPERLVLSSSEFGHAYLANGWATRFVRALLETYVIVLVGYRASDPPIRYLLEGLRSERNKRSIYAFESGSSDEVAGRWSSLGVVGIPYGPSTTRAHSELWNTLEAWAARADDPAAWRRSIVSLAQRPPSTLKPHERGQVAALVRTREGAALFADATPVVPPEWLCVFDARIRCAQLSAYDSEPNPGEQFGLDDDPPAITEEPSDDTQKVRFPNDLVSLQITDERTDRFRRLAGVPAKAVDRLPPRLSSLQRWYSNVAGTPTAVWWAAGYESIQSEMLAGVKWTMQYGPNSIADEMRTAWLLLIQQFQDAESRSRF